MGFRLMRTLQELATSEIDELFHRDVSVFDPDEKASKVLGELRETGRYEATVSSGGKFGIITIRDMLDVTQPTQTRINGHWSVIGFASPTDPVIKITEVLIRNNVRALPVVEDGDVVGIVSQVDLNKALCDVSELEGIKAKELMRSPVISLDVSERVAFARRLMLERGFSHVPIVEYNRLVGMVTAESIVHTFITPLGKTTIGDRAGQKGTRFSGLVNRIMDFHPLAIETEASALEAARGLRDQQKSACLLTDERKTILGIITPRELIGLMLRLRTKDELPVYIIGVSDEDFFERAVAEEKVRRVVMRSMKIHPHIQEVSIRIKRSQAGGTRTRYEATARVLSPEEQSLAKTEGWDLIAVFDELCDKLEKALKTSKHKPERRPRRRRFRR